MRHVQTEKQKVDHEVQTRIYILQNKPTKALSNRGCQTIITTEPDQSIQTILALFQFVPEQEIEKGAIHEIKLPRAALLQWKLPLVGYEQIKQEQVRHKYELARAQTNTSNDIVNNNTTRGVLKKRYSDSELGEWAALLALSHPQAMADQQVDKETQTNFTVRPHVLGDEGVAQLAKASSLQTSLTFEPDASITDFQPMLIQDVDHYHTYLSTITPKPYVESSKDDILNEQNELVTESIPVKFKQKYQTTEDHDNAHGLRECPTNTGPHTTYDQFVELLLSDLANKSIPDDVKEFLLQEFAELNNNIIAEHELNAKGIKAEQTNNGLDDEFENAVVQIMNSCVYNIEDQLKRITETFDTYQRDFKKLNHQQHIHSDAQNESKASMAQNHPVNIPQDYQSPQETKDIGHGTTPRPIEMQGDSNLKHQVDVLCECCHLTAEGAAVPMLGDPHEMEGKAPITFDVVIGADGIELKNKTNSSPVAGEQIIRFSIVPSQPQVNKQGTSTLNSVQQNLFEIHVSIPDITKVQMPNDAFGNYLGTQTDCTVVLPPKKNMRSSEDYLDINATSQKIGMMFEQDADYIEPYICNVEDITVPINMLHPPTNTKKTKTIAKPMDVQEDKDCSAIIEIPWESIALQVILVEEQQDLHEVGCCRDHIDPSCTRTYCPMGAYHKGHSPTPYTVEFDYNDEEYASKTRLFENTEGEEEDDDMDYEPAVTRKSVLTASTSEIHASFSDIFVHEKKDVKNMQRKRIPPESLVYDTKFVRHNEPYMDYMYNHFPDDYINGNCGSETEIPWEQFILPTNLKIRKIKKAGPLGILSKVKPQGNFPTAKNVVNKINMNTHELDPSAEEPLASALNALIGKAQDGIASEYGLNLNFTSETLSNIFFVEGAAASQKSMSNYSTMSDFRFSAKRCPKNTAIGINLADGTVQTVVAGSETFELGAYVNDLSAITVELKPFTDCLHKSDPRNLIKDKTADDGAITSLLGSRLTETQSLAAYSVRVPLYTPTYQTKSMPEIPSRANVTFPREPAVSVAPPSIVGTENDVTSIANKSNKDPLASALEAYRAEMKPLREALDKLKEEVRELNLPQLTPNYYSGYPQQYPNPNMPYPGPSVRHTTAISNGCGTRTSTRMKPLFMQNLVGSEYSQLQYPPPSTAMPPMPYYMPSQQYPPMPYPVPGMVPYQQAPMNQQPSDLYSHHEYTPINPPSCKSRRKKKRNKEGSVASKESQLSQKASNSKKKKCSKPSCPNKNKSCGEDNIETHYGPKDILDNASEISMKATCYVINNKYKIEISPEQAPTVQKQTTTTEASRMIQISSSTYTAVELPDVETLPDSRKDHPSNH